MSSPDDDSSGEHGESIPGPPWILGHRGAPRERPENTLVSLRRALELGLDGVEYDVQACLGGEGVLLHDETLDRTTDLAGPISEVPLSELVHADAGGWFARRFVGEPLPMLEEALELDGGLQSSAQGLAHHMIELKDPALVPVVAAALARLARPLPFRIASFHRSVCLEARDANLPAMLLTEEANERDFRFVRDERIQAYGTAPRGWHTQAGRERWDCERWSWSVDEPGDLLEACRLPLFAFNTNEPRRALAIRALVKLAPEYTGPYPLGVPELEVERAGQRFLSDEDEGARPQGEWTGSWAFEIRVTNPFGFPVKAALALIPRGGAFQVEGLPANFALDSHAEAQRAVTLRGGSFSPIEDPSLVLRLAWREGRRTRALVFDAPLARVRTLRLGPGAQRLRMLCEGPRDRDASMAIRERRGELITVVEDSGGLEDVAARIRVAHRVHRGRRGVRIRLPEETGSEGLLFCAGFEGTDPETGERRFRRFAGGLPYGLGSGAPARLFPAGRA